MGSGNISLKKQISASYALASNQDTLDVLLTKRELAIRLNVSTRLIDELMCRRKIPFLRLGYRTIRFEWKRVQQAIEKLEIQEVGRK